ncbi:MAG: hypothetical protein IKW20_04565 [Bacteroidales bacterium]|nr:hypothetical protein [Bacteroidales bacterium]
MDYRYECLPELESKQARKRIVVLTGAGVSVESGLPTYRSDDFQNHRFQDGRRNRTKIE